jgi:hypothetical protein
LILDLITDGRAIAENVDITDLEDTITSLEANVTDMLESIKRLEAHKEKIAGTRNMP